MGKKEAKTNAIRILETMKIPYEARTYECDDFVDAAQIADKLGLDHAGMYKTITTVGKSGGYYVFVVPIDDEIDFKKAAKAAGEKSIEMLHLKDLTKVTARLWPTTSSANLMPKAVSLPPAPTTLTTK